MPDKKNHEIIHHEIIHHEIIEGYHPVAESMEAGVRLKEILLLTNADNKSRDYAEIERKAKERGIKVSKVTKDRFDRVAVSGRHQGIAAVAAAYQYTDVDDILKMAKENGEAVFLVFLDGIEDPHNLGAIIRSAHCMGAHGVVIRENRAAGVTPSVARVSAGACYHIPVAMVTNLAKEIERLKKRGLWFACLDMGADAIYKADLKGDIGLVVGAEGSGVSRLIKERCDFTVSIPMQGKIGSLNASVAFGMAAYEAVRQREAGKVTSAPPSAHRPNP